MPYYIWKNKDGKITSYDQAEGYRPPPAIEITKEEFEKLGFYRAPTESKPESSNELQTPTDALLDGINSI